MNTDYVQRFLFEELEIRGRLVCLTGAWRRMLEGRDYPPEIAALLGHHSMDMTLRYAKIANRTVADEYFAVTDHVDASTPKQLRCPPTPVAEDLD